MPRLAISYFRIPMGSVTISIFVPGRVPLPRELGEYIVIRKAIQITETVLHNGASEKPM